MAFPTFKSDKSMANQPWPLTMQKNTIYILKANFLLKAYCIFQILPRENS